MTLYDEFVRVLPDTPPDLDWHGPDYGALPAVEPDSADVAWIDQPYEPAEIDAPTAAVVAGLCAICHTSEPPCDSRNGDGEPEHRECVEAFHEALAESRAGR